MRSLVIAGLVAELIGCNSRPAPPPAPAASEAGPSVAPAPRFLVVQLRRIQIIDRHPEDGDEPPSNATTPRYAIPSYAARPADHRPEIHTYDRTLAIPELATQTFDLALDDAAQYHLVVLARGWAEGPDHEIRLDSTELTTWAIAHSTGGAEGPNPTSWGAVPLALDAWHGSDVMRVRERSFVYYELAERRYGPIVTAPPADALRGAPDTLAGQETRRIDATRQARRVELP